MELDIIEHAYLFSVDDKALLLSRFVSPSSGRFEIIFLERQHEAEAAGYPQLA